MYQFTEASARYFFRSPLALFRGSASATAIPLFWQIWQCALASPLFAIAILSVVRYSTKAKFSSEQYSIKMLSNIVCLFIEKQ
jgi:hypothetical protein